MKHVKKGFTLKGISIGDIRDGSMFVGVDDDGVNVADVAVLRTETQYQQTMGECEEVVYGLEEYEHSDKIEWLDSNYNPLDRYFKAWI